MSRHSRQPPVTLACQMLAKYVVDAIRQMRRNGWASVEVEASAQASYNRELQARSQGTVWTSGCSSWYLGAGGRNTTIWPDSTFRFRRLSRRFDAGAYRVSTEEA